MKAFFLTISLCFAVSAIIAQIDPSVINKDNKKFHDPRNLKPATIIPKEVSFSATITQPREIITSTAANGILIGFDELKWNEGNGFNASTGVFTATAPGLYNLILNVTFSNYGCLNYPLSCPVRVIRNSTETIERINFPVAHGGTNYSTSQHYSLLVQLKLNDKIALMPQSVGCEGGLRPEFKRFSFSGYKIN